MSSSKTSVTLYHEVVPHKTRILITVLSYTLHGVCRTKLPTIYMGITVVQSKSRYGKRQIYSPFNHMLYLQSSPTELSEQISNTFKKL